MKRISLILVVIAGLAGGAFAAAPVSAPFEFVSVSGGTFAMGCGAWQSDCGSMEKPTRTVKVGRFELGKHEVTQRQWREVVGRDPPGLHFKGCDDCPVEGVSLDKVQAFLRQLNAGRDGPYRLPTETEWEYVCRSGGKNEKYCGGPDLNHLAWHSFNSGFMTHPVGTRTPNGLGLYDMSGNVWEWTCSRVG